MDNPEENTKQLDNNDNIEPKSSVESECQPETNSSAGRVGETEGGQVAEATIILEDATEPSRSAESEETLEESGGSTQDPREQETETAFPDTSSSDSPESRPLSAVRAQLKKYQRPIAGFIVGTCVLFSVYGITGLVTKGKEEQRKTVSVQVYRASVENGTADILHLARFLVFLAEKGDRAYLLLSLSIKPSNSAVYSEVDEKMTLCRAAIYGVLSKIAMGEMEQVDSRKKLKKDIIDAINAVLVTGTVDRIDFTEFLLV